MKKKVIYNTVQKFSTLKEMISLAVKQAGEKIAFKHTSDNEVILHTYSDFSNDIHSIGTALAELGVVGGKHIACIGANSYKWLCTYLSSLCGDNVHVPIDKELPEKDILNVLKNSESKVVFFDKRYFDLFVRNRDALGLEVLVCFDITEDTDGVLSFNKLLKHGYELYKNGNTEYSSRQSDLDSLKMLVYTSGTTGNAKGVMLSERNLVCSVYYGLHVATVDTCCLSVLPYHHVYEAVSGILVALHKHVTICINDSLTMVLKNIQLFKPTYIYLVPAFAEIFYKRIWANAESTGKDKVLKIMIKVSNGLRKVGIDLRRKLFSSIHTNFGGNLEKIVCGGAPIRAEIGDFFNSIGITLLNGYGITECSPLVSVNQEHFNDCSTVGLPLPCVEVKISEPNEEGIGEICVKGEIVMIGYYKNEEETAKVLKDGWFYTGDYGTVNKYGQISITGRKKNLIVLDNGKNIYPEEIENYIMNINYISEVIVSGIKDGDSDVGLSAEVYLNKEEVAKFESEDIESKLKKDIMEELKELPSYKNISKIIIRKEPFIKTTSNKIKRQNAMTK